MKKIFYCLPFLLCISPVIAQTVPQTIDELLKAYSNQYAFNGTVLVAQKGNVLLKKGYGFKNAASHSQNDENTIFQIGSITKQFTSAIILQLQEKNLLSVQDKLSKYISDYPDGDSITIENLLTHTSGIFNYTNDESFMQTKASEPITLEHLIGLFKNKPLDFKPGKKYNYSNSGYILLGYIIEKVTGKSYFDVVRENIFQPLHMDHSGFDFNGLKSPDKAVGYLKLTPKNSVPASIVDSSVSYAAGSIYTTVGDLYKWDQALYTDRIISSSSLQQAFTPHQSNYGYGWVIDSAYGKKAVMHEGGIFGFVSFIVRILADSTCIIIFDNRSSPGLAKIAEDIDAILNDQPYDFPMPRTEIEVDTAILRQYTGQYELRPGFVLTISLEDGQLVAQGTGQARIELYPEKINFFFTKIIQAQIEFIRDPNGKTTRLTLYQGGQELQAKKIK